jgi:hypothetical protein
MKRPTLTLAAIALSAGVIGCSQHEAPPPPSTTPNAQEMPTPPPPASPSPPATPSDTPPPGAQPAPSTPNTSQ